jgi:ribosomal protein L37E
MTHRGQIADKRHVWCAECGRKTHINADECGACGFSNGDDPFGVRNRENVGTPEYTGGSDE